MSNLRLSNLIPWIVLAVLLVPVAGPPLDGYFFPVRVDQRMERVARTRGTLCWHWVSLKVQRRTSDNIDAFAIYTLPGDAEPQREVVAPWQEQTRRGWTRASALPPTGHPDDQPWCINLPASVTPNMPITLEQTAYYPGSVPLWHVRLRLPDITSSGLAE